MRTPHPFPLRFLILSRLFAVLAALPMLAGTALAHPGHYHPPDETDEFDSFAAGFQHPFTGVDHALLALAIGWLLLARVNRAGALQAVYFLPSLLVGALIGRVFGAAPGLEAALACTLLCCGVLFLLCKNPRALVPFSLVSLAGLIHGLAHGAEALPGQSFGSLMAGMVLGSAALMIIGASLGRASTLVRGTVPARIAGASLLASGAACLWNAI